MPDREKVKKGLEALRDAMSKHQCYVCSHEFIDAADEFGTNIIDDAIALLKEQGTEAEWIYGEDKTGVDGWYCSECNFFEPWFYEFTEDIDFIRFYGHCPSCGRKMTSYTGKPTNEEEGAK